MNDTLLTKTIASTATLKIANINSFDLFYTPIEERFERITRIARRALHAPVAAISLLNDDKQWFKSAAGWGISELPRDQAICKLTVEANQIVMIGEGEGGIVSYPNFADWKDDRSLFASTSAVRGDESYNLTGGGEPERLQGRLVSAGFLSTLKVNPILGHDFTPDDDRPGAPPKVLLSHVFWNRRFNADPAIVGRPIPRSAPPPFRRQCHGGGRACGSRARELLPVVSSVRHQSRRL